MAAWCAGQQGRSITEKIEELAGLADCSTTTILAVIRGERRLNLRCSRALVAGLDLPAEHGAHLLDIFELQHAPPRLAQARRQAVLERVALASGARSGPSTLLLEEGRSDASAVALLGSALEALEEDRPVDRTLLRGGVPAMTLQNLKDAANSPSCATRLGPRLVALHDPSASKTASLAHHGALSMARDGLMRLRAAERDFRSFVASCDEEGFLALEGPCRTYAEGLRALAEESELRPPSRVMLTQVQRLVAAGPFPAGAFQGDLRWRRPTVEFSPLDRPLPHPPLSAHGLSVDGAAPARPHPTGITWFPTWVAIWRAWATAAGQECSDTWLAQKTGLPRATVYDLSMGVARFDSRHVFAFLAAFGLEGDKEAQLALEGMAMVAMCGNDVERAAILLSTLRGLGLKRGVRNLAAESYFLESNWYSKVIANLPELPGFQPLHGWICRAMKGRLSWTAVQEVLDALAATGMFRRDADGRTVVAADVVRIEGPHNAASQYELFTGMLSLFRAELDNRDPDLTLNTWLMALPEQALPRLTRLNETWTTSVRNVLMAAQERRVRGAPMDRVVVISRQSFPLFRLPTPKKRGHSAQKKSGSTAKGA